MSDEKKPFDEWALLELFGHQRIAGRVSEANIGGGAFIRVDVPANDRAGAFTRFYGPGAVYSISPVSEAIARDLAEQYQAVSVQRYDLSHLIEDRSDPEPEEPEEP